MSDMGGATQSFLLALSALFSIINPIGSAFIFSQVTANRTPAERRRLAARIGVYSALVMLGALWIGASVLAFFGVSMSALRIAGGLVVSAWAWSLLNQPEEREARKEEQAAPAEVEADVAFFPLTMPFTTGPGTISVAIALGSNEPAGAPLAYLGPSAAAVVMAAVIWIAYAYADTLIAFLGRAGARVVTRLAAFLMLCVGVQITLNGVTDVVRGMG
jgi:multiple antibiotic resistance protein